MDLKQRIEDVLKTYCDRCDLDGCCCLNSMIREAIDNDIKTEIKKDEKWRRGIRIEGKKE